jgi:hypothetical protein
VASDPTKRRRKAHLQHLRDGREEEAAFDAWWDTLTAEQQKGYRSLNPPIIPYREMPLPRFAFPVYANDSKFASDDPRKQKEGKDEDGWVTRERVQEIVSDVLAMLGASSDKAVIAHFDLVKIILQTPDAPTQSALAERLGLTKQAVSVRVKKLVAFAGLTAPGLLTRIKQSAPVSDDNNDENLNDYNKNLNEVFKKSITPPGVRRGASTTAKKRKLGVSNYPETHQPDRAD